MTYNDKFLIILINKGEIIIMTFAEKVLYVRTKLLLTQFQLAKELGVSLVTIARWETQNKKPQAVQYGKFLAFCEKKHIIFE